MVLDVLVVFVPEAPVVSAAVVAAASLEAAVEVASAVADAFAPEDAAATAVDDAACAGVLISLRSNDGYEIHTV